MKKMVSIFVVVVLLFVLSGCGTWKRMGTLTSLKSEPMLNKEEYYNNLQTKYNAQNLDKLQSDKNLTATARNNVINDLLILSDYSYGQFIEKLFVVNSSSNVFFDVLAISLSAAGALASDAGLAKIFSGSSAGIQGIQSSTNERFFADKTMEAIIYSMDKERAIVRKQIFDGMQLSIDDYRLSDGVRDAQRYNEAGSFVVGLTRLSQTAANEKLEAENKADEALMNLMKKNLSNTQLDRKEKPLPAK